MILFARNRLRALFVLIFAYDMQIQVAHALCKQGCRLISYTADIRLVTIATCYNCPRSPLRFRRAFSKKCLRRPTAKIIAIFSDFCNFKIKPEMRDVLTKMRECGKYAKMRDYPHDCGTVDTYELSRSSLRLMAVSLVAWSPNGDR